MSWAGGKTFRVEKAVTIYFSWSSTQSQQARILADLRSRCDNLIGSSSGGGSGMGCGRGIGSGTGTGSPGIGSGTGICK
ncbi:hypothetical protein DU289_22235 [Escherichia coli]|nr:hypothetical protein DU289_22235 [Escherichia coli]